MVTKRFLGERTFYCLVLLASFTLFSGSLWQASTSSYTQVLSLKPLHETNRMGSKESYEIMYFFYIFINLLSSVASPITVHFALKSTRRGGINMIFFTQRLYVAQASSSLALNIVLWLPWIHLCRAYETAYVTCFAGSIGWLGLYALIMCFSLLCATEMFKKYTSHPQESMRKGKSSKVLNHEAYGEEKSSTVQAFAIV